jgi:hypothetical protein
MYRLVPLLLLLLFPPMAIAGSMDGDDKDGGGEHHVDLIMRKVSVTPVLARVGDVVKFEMEWEWYDFITYDALYDRTVAEVWANGKVVASKPFTDNHGRRVGELYRETFLWDTKGAKPGEYRIRGEVTLRTDIRPYDNYLVVREPVVLLPAGAQIPAGKDASRTAVVEYPY